MASRRSTRTKSKIQPLEGGGPRAKRRKDIVNVAEASRPGLEELCEGSAAQRFREEITDVKQGALVATPSTLEQAIGGNLYVPQEGSLAEAPVSLYLPQEGSLGAATSPGNVHVPQEGSLGAGVSPGNLHVPQQGSLGAGVSPGAIMGSLQWCKYTDGKVPKDAVNGGWDAHSSEPLFVGRARRGKHLIIGKVQPSHQCIYVPFAGREHRYNRYEVLVNPGNLVKLEWVNAKNGEVPKEAVQGGYDTTSGKEVYYIGRSSHYGNTLPGKIHPSHRCCYVSWNTRELTKNEYNILVAK